jgi:hypothetical protein
MRMMSLQVWQPLRALIVAQAISQNALRVDAPSLCISIQARQHGVDIPSFVPGILKAPTPLTMLKTSCSKTVSAFTLLDHC